MFEELVLVVGPVDGEREGSRGRMLPMPPRPEERCTQKETGIIECELTARESDDGESEDEDVRLQEFWSLPTFLVR